MLDYLSRNAIKRGRVFRVVTGVVLGVVSIAVMLLGWRLPNGVIVDTRTVVLGIGTLLYGPVPGIIGGAIAAAFRVGLGGAGTLVGVLIIAMPVTVGALWRHQAGAAARPSLWRALSVRSGRSQILREARVSAVADTYEAMIFDRPCRPGLPVETAITELRDHTGVRYESEVVEACLAVLEEGFAFREA